MNLYELFVKISAETSGLEKGISAAGQLVKGFAKVSAAAVGAAATGLTVLAKQAVSAYADYEQLAGGVETLFKGNAQTVIENAQNAYKTAGLSANEYMETVTSTSAALINSVGGDTAKAAELANTAITDMADNANKMGTSIESLQNAYTGFSRGNFTMLDNLALGFAGTKEGMQQLLDKAKELSGVEYDISSYADIVEAIHVVQTEMDISGISIEEYNKLVESGAMTQEEAFELLGTTAKEASTTIQGSIASMKASWENWLTSLADSNGNVEETTAQLVESATTAFNNILPVVTTVFDNLVPVINEKAPEIVSMLSELIIDNMPMIIDAGTQLLIALITGIANNLPQLIESAGEIVETISDALKDSWPLLKEAGINALNAIWDGIKSIASSIGEWVSGWWSRLWAGKDASAEMNARGGSGRAGGLDYVPYNGFNATLHRGESVLTAREAEAWRNGGGNGGTARETVIPITLNLNSNIDGMRFAENQYKYNLIVSRNHGVRMVNA